MHVAETGREEKKAVKYAKQHVSHGARYKSKRTGPSTVLGCGSATQRSAVQEELLKGKGKRPRERDPRWVSSSCRRFDWRRAGLGRRSERKRPSRPWFRCSAIAVVTVQCHHLPVSM